MGQFNSKYDISLVFHSDTTQAQKNVVELVNTLQKISNPMTIGIQNGSIEQGVKSAQALEAALKNAVNVDTGKLDLVKFNSSLKSAGTNINQVGQNLINLGPTGQKAFVKLSNSIAQAEVPLHKYSKTVENLITTLGNTIKWQLASSAIHGFSSVIQSAIGHAKNLNRALNDIQIVSGFSDIAMANFADQAKQAAEILHTTTTEYAKASLIFFQQGDTTKQAMEKANTVIKLAQVTGESVQTVSDQMTAIWNNFYNGSKSLEYYADALAALGAATASSTDEIANGLQKFAAIGDTIGLSFEYAASALATVVAETRESEEVVGTSFKTIFARLQGLQLGEVQSDGTDLNKYSKALETIGINIKLSNGEIKDMDDILDELGEKWQILGEETKIAFAQTAGGLRQYNQLIALMDNWDKVKGNVGLVENSEGELKEQADIWGKSWEAASNRVKKAQDDLYEKFVNDKTITTITNLFADLIKGLNGFIERLGGIGPTLGLVLGMFSNKLLPIMTAGFTKMGAGIKNIFISSEQQALELQRNVRSQMSSMLSGLDGSEQIRQSIELSMKLAQEKEKLVLASKNMTIAQKEEAQARMAVYSEMITETQELLEQNRALEEQIALQESKVFTREDKIGLATNNVANNFIENKDASAQFDDNQKAEIIETVNDWSFSEIEEAMTLAQKSVDRLNQEIEKTEESIKQAENAMNNFSQSTFEGIKDQGFDYTGDIDTYLSDLSEEKTTQESILENAKSLKEQREIEIKQLEEALKLKREIWEKSKDPNTLSFGKVQAVSFEDTIDAHRSGERAQDKSLASMETGISQSIKAEFGMTKEDFEKPLQTDASVENLKKVYEQMNKYNSAMNKSNAIKQDVINMSKKLNQSNVTELKNIEKRIKELKKEQGPYKKSSKMYKERQEEIDKLEKKYKALNKTSKNFVKTSKSELTSLSKSSSAFMELAKTSNMSEAEMKELAQAFKIVEQASQGNLDDFNQLGNALTTIQNKSNLMALAFQDTKDDLDSFANSMTQMMLKGKVSKEEMAKLIQMLKTMGINTEQLEERLKGLGLGFDTKISKLQEATTQIGNLTSGLMSGAMAVQSFQTAFSEDASAMERFMGILSGISSVLNMVNAAQEISNFLKEKATVYLAKHSAANLVDGATEILNKEATEESTKATQKNTIAKIANWFATGPSGWVIAGIAIALIAGITAMTLANTDATEANTEAKKESAEQAMDNAEKSKSAREGWVEETEAVDELVAEYKKLKKAGEDVSEVQNNIIDSLPDLIESYETMLDTLDKTSSGYYRLAEAIRDVKRAEALGDTEKIIEAKEKADEIATEESYNQVKSGMAGSIKAVEAALENSSNVSVDGNKIQLSFSGNDSGDEGNEEQKTLQIIKKYMGGALNIESGELEGEQNGTDYTASLTLDTSDPQSFIASYENLMKAYNEMEKEFNKEEKESGGIYEGLKAQLDAAKTEYEAMIGYKEELGNYTALTIKNSIKNEKMRDGESFDITNIDTLEEYQEYKNKLFKAAEMSSDPNAKSSVEKWLNSLNGLKKFEKAELRFEGLQKNFSVAYSEQMKTLYKNLTSEQQELFLNINFDEKKTELEVMKEIENAQLTADLNAIQLKVETISNAREKVKSGEMSIVDWQNFKTDSGIAWNEEGNISYEEFMGKSQEDKIAYLDDLEQKQYDEMYSTVRNSHQAEKNDIEKRKKHLQFLWDTYGEDYKNVTKDEGGFTTREEYLQRVAELDAEAAALEQQEEDLINTQEELRYKSEVKDLGLNVENWEKYKEYLKTLPEYAEKTSDELNKITTDLMVQNQALKDLRDGWKDWKKAIELGEVGDENRGIAITNIRSALAKRLGIDENTASSLLTDEFIDENLDLFDRAIMSGDSEAANQAIAKIEEVGRNKALEGETITKTEITANVGRFETVEGTSAYDIFQGIEKGLGDNQILNNIISTGRTYAFSENALGFITTGQKNAHDIGYQDLVNKGASWADLSGYNECGYMEKINANLTEIADAFFNNIILDYDNGIIDFSESMNALEKLQIWKEAPGNGLNKNKILSLLLYGLQSKIPEDILNNMQISGLETSLGNLIKNTIDFSLADDPQYYEEAEKLFTDNTFSVDLLGQKEWVYGEVGTGKYKIESDKAIDTTGFTVDNYKEKWNELLTNNKGAIDLYDSQGNLISENLDLDVNNMGYEEFMKAIGYIYNTDTNTWEANGILKIGYNLNVDSETLTGDAKSIAELSYGIDGQTFDAYTELLKKLRPELDLTKEEWAKLTLEAIKQDKALQDISKNQESWNKTLTSDTTTELEKIEAANEAASAFSLLMNFDLDNTTILNYWDGITDAIKKGGKELTEYLLKLQAIEEIAKIEDSKESRNERLSESDFISLYGSLITLNEGEKKDLDTILNKFYGSSVFPTDGPWAEFKAQIKSGSLSENQISDFLNQNSDVIYNFRTGKYILGEQSVNTTGVSSIQVEKALNDWALGKYGMNKDNRIDITLSKNYLSQYSDIIDFLNRMGQSEVLLDGVKYNLNNIADPTAFVQAWNNASTILGNDYTTQTDRQDKIRTMIEDSTPDDIELTTIDDLIKRYKEIDNRIESIENSLNKVKNAKEEAFGTKRLEEMNKELTLINYQLDKTREKYGKYSATENSWSKNSHKDYLQRDYSSLINAYKDVSKEINGIPELIIPKIIDDKQGMTYFGKEVWEAMDWDFANGSYYDRAKNITEIIEIAQTEIVARQKWLNNNKEASNYEEYQKDTESLIELVNTLVEAEEQYETTRQEGMELLNQMEELEAQWKSSNYEILTYKMELQVNVEDMELTFLERKIEDLKNDIFSMSEAFLYFYPSLDGKQGAGAMVQQSYDKLSMYNDQLFELNWRKGLSAEQGGITDADYYEGIKGIIGGVNEESQSLRTLKETMSTYYSETLEMANEKLDIYIGQLEHINEIYDHYKNIIELITPMQYKMLQNDETFSKTFGKNQYDMLKSISTQRINNLQQTNSVQKKLLEEQQKETENLQAQYDKIMAEYISAAEQGLDTTSLASQLNVLEDSITAALEKTQELSNTVMENIAEILEAYKEQLEADIEEIVKSTENKLTQGLGFETISERFSRASTYQEEYLTTTNKIYETEKLINKAQQEIDKTNNTTSKNNLKNFIESTKQLKEKTKLTELELKIAQAQYDITLAQNALDEAKNAKTNVRLTRDSEGNFGYVYTANAEAINKAEQDLADKENALYNTVLEAANDYGQKKFEIQQEWFEAQNDLNERYRNGEIESEEAYLAEKAQIDEQYYNLLSIYDYNYTLALGHELMKREEAWITNYDNMLYKSDDFKTEIQNHLISLDQAWQDYVEKTNPYIIENSKYIDENKLSVAYLEEETKELTDLLLGKDGNKGLVQVLKDETLEVSNLTTAFAQMIPVLDSAIAEADKFAESLAKIYAKGAGQEKNFSTENKIKYFDPNKDYSVELAKHILNGGKYGDKTFEKLTEERYNKAESLELDEYGKDSSWSKNLNQIFKAYSELSKQQRESEIGESLTRMLQQIANGEIQFNNNWFATWINRYNKLVPKNKLTMSMQQFDTGGYTGAWGTEGRWAMLHQKELVLNANDTENFLQATGILRSIAQAIDLEALNHQASLFSTLGSTLLPQSNGTLEQDVHIEAHFPNVTDRNEIEEAFNTLINTASQYANRKTI